MGTIVLLSAQHQFSSSKCAVRAALSKAINGMHWRPRIVLPKELDGTAGTVLALDIRDTAAHEIDAQHLSAAKARERLGWQPNHTIEEALVDTVRWYADHLRR